MPSFVHKIDVNSPLIQYQGPWIRGGSKADPRGPDADTEQPKYDQETFMFCFPGSICSATLNFNGTEIHIVGAFRPNTGLVQVQLDGESFGPFAPTPDEQFQIDRFNKTNLLDGPHQMTISNSASSDKTFDLDFFTWTSNVNSLVDSRFQDSSVAFVYAPSDAWSTDMSKLPGFDDGTGHSTFNRADASVNFSFMGDRIALYGAIGGQAAPFTAQVDNGPIHSLTEMQSISDEATEDYLPNQLIYYADSLGSGNHTIILKSQSSSPSQTLSIDYALVDGNVNTVSSTSSSPSLISSSTQGTRILKQICFSSKQIAGLAVGFSVLSLVTVLALGYILYLRRSVRHTTRQSEPLDPFSVPLQFGGRITPRQGKQSLMTGMTELFPRPPTYAP